MKVVYARCAGMDVHKETVNVCIRIGEGKKLEIVAALFGTFTADLERLRDFLREHKVRRLVMESTGVYWIPVWNVLERGAWKFDLVLVNPQHVRALPGRKTDHNDCKRLAELGQYDLLSGSFIPPREIRELRDLTRLRSHVQGDRNRILNRIDRLLQTANFKLTSVASDIVGKTGWLILNAMAHGETNPYRLAEQAQASLQLKKAELAQALHGYSSEHFRWLLREFLEQLSRLDDKLNELDGRIRQRMQPYADLVRRLCTIPGVKETTAWALIAELGTDMSRFPDAHHVASWAGLCPGNAESAGKRQSGRTRKGDRYLRRVLIQNAWSLVRKKDCFLTALFFRMASRHGEKRAAVAVAHRLLIIAYCILRDGREYQEIGGDYYDRRNPERTARRLTRRLERIGYRVTLTKPGLSAAEPASKPIRNGTTRWTTPSRRGSQLKIPGPIATRDVCPKCASWKIPCIHGRTTLGEDVKPASPSPPPAPVDKPATHSKRRRGRPCKCTQRGVPCTHQNKSKSPTTEFSAPDLSAT